MPPTTMPLLVIAIIGAIVCLIVWAAAKATKRAAENITQLAATLGLQVVAKPPTMGLFYSEPRASGQWRGKQVEIFSFSTGSGKSRTQWCAISAKPRTDSGLLFALVRQGLGTKVMELFGASEIQVGDAEFDRKWFIQTSDPDFLRAALLPELREKINALADDPGTWGGKFQLEGGVVRYAEQGSFASSKVAARIGRMAEIVADLADLAEVHAGQRT